jgi:hypothetical protein
MPDGSLTGIGASVKRKEDYRFLVGEGNYTDDINRPNQTQSNLYRYKENYNKTLEFGGYELDVGKHYDSIKNSYSGKKKGKGQDSSLKGEKRVSAVPCAKSCALVLPLLSKLKNPPVKESATPPTTPLNPLFSPFKDES